MEKLYSLVAKVLDIEALTITPETSPDTVENWDSFNGLMLVSELENVFGVKFTMDEIVAVKKVGDITEALKRHGVELE